MKHKRAIFYAVRLLLVSFLVGVALECCDPHSPSGLGKRIAEQVTTLTR